MRRIAWALVVARFPFDHDLHSDFYTLFSSTTICFRGYHLCKGYTLDDNAFLVFHYNGASLNGVIMELKGASQ